MKEEGKKRRRHLQVSGQEEACSRARFYRFNLYGAVVVFAEERGRLAECFCGCGRKMLPLPGTYSPEAAGGCNKSNVSDVIPMMNTKRLRRDLSENIIYLVLWATLFMAPVLGEYIRSTHDESFSFNWQQITDIGKVYLIYFAVFLIHNFFVAPILICKHRLGRYLAALAVLLIVSADGTVISQRLLIGDSCFFNTFNIHPEKTYSEDGWGVNHQLLRQFGKNDDERRIVTADGTQNFEVGAVYPDMVYQNVMREEEHPTPFLILNVGEFHDEADITDKFNNYVNRSYGKPRQALVKYHGERKKVEDAIKRQIRAITGQEAGEVHELIQIHEEWYKNYQRFLSVLMVFTAVALLIAVLGLMAMNSYFISQRRREIAIRRVFGAEISSITLRLLLTVVIQSVVAMLIAIPLSYWLAPMVSSISGLTIRMELMPLLLSLVIVLAVNLLTAFFQSWRAATENPINSIKTE